MRTWGVNDLAVENDGAGFRTYVGGGGRERDILMGGGGRDCIPCGLCDVADLVGRDGGEGGVLLG